MSEEIITEVLVKSLTKKEISNLEKNPPTKKKSKPINLAVIGSHFYRKWLPPKRKSANFFTLVYNVVILYENGEYTIVLAETYEKKLKEQQEIVNRKYDPVAAALTMKKEIEDKGLTRAEYARMIGCSRANITKRLKHIDKTI